MDYSCSTIQQSKELQANEILNWKLKCSDAISGIIGRPSKSALARAQQYGNKKLIQIEKKRYLSHKDLYDKLVNYSMESAKEAGYNSNLIDPVQHASDWQNIWGRHLRGKITPTTIQLGPKRIPSIIRLTDRIINKRNKLAKSEKGISKTDLFLSPPEFIAAHVDRFGFLGPLINKILTIGDRNISMAGKFLNPITEARKEAYDRILNLIKGTGNNAYFNNSVMDGIEVIDKNSNRVTLVKSVTRDVEGFEGYPSEQKDQDKKDIRFYSYDDLQESKSSIDELITSKYTDELMDEIGNGQVRYVIPKIIKRELDEKGLLSDDSMEGNDLKILNGKLKQLTVAREKGDRVPGIHTTRVKADRGIWEYRYVMIKQGEGEDIKDPSKKETYNVYLIDKARIDLKSNKRAEGTNVNFLGATLSEVDGEVSKEYVSYDESELGKVLAEGWYRSDEINDFGKQTRKVKGKDEVQYKEIKGTHKKQYINFRRYAGSDYVFDSKKEAEGYGQLNINEPNEMLTEHIWKSLTIVRDNYQKAYTDIKSKADKQLARRNAVRKNIIKWRMAKKGESEEDADKWLNTFFKANGIQSTLWENEQGELQTPTAFSRPKAENYFPNKYTKTQVFMNMLPSSITSVENKLDTEIKKVLKDGNKTLEHLLEAKTLLKDQNEYKDSDLERLELGLEHLHNILNRVAKNEEADQSLFDLPSLKNLKHITAWTDPLLRRKDGRVHHEYFHETYNALNKQEVINELAESVFKIEKLGSLPKGTLEFAVNRVKIGFGDPTSRAISITGKETSYENFADKLNGLPSFIRGGRTWSPKQAERLTKWLTAPASMLFLGGSSAVQNSGQIINTMIQVGWDNIREAQKAMDKDETKWKTIAQHTGALNLLTMFTDIMMKDGEPRGDDMGFIPTPGIQIPTLKPIRLARLLNAGRENFVKNGEDSIDLLLMKMIKIQEGSSREDIQNLKDINDLKKSIHNKDLRKKREQFYSIFTLEKGTSEKVIEQLFRDTLGDVSDSLIKRMVSWKLSWWFEGVGGKNIFTFTGSEEKLRTTTIVASLLHAQKIGLIDSDSNKSDEEIFMTPAAVEIARNAVYYTQFGMTPPYLGEGFNGFGRALWQYKQYPTLQMIHDYQTYKRFSDGSEGTFDGMTRLLNALSIQMQSVTQGKKYDPSDRNIDHEAIAMLRFISTRVLASTVASIVTAIPILSYLLRGGAVNMYGLMRGAENPMLAIAFRTMIWGSLFAMGADDDEERKRNEVTNALSFLFFPVMIGSILNASKDIYEWYED